MNVLFLSMTFPDNFNPERGTYNLELCAALARQHRVQVIAPRSWHEWLDVKRAGGSYAASADTQAHAVPVAFPVFWYIPRVKPQLMGQAIWQSIRGTVRKLAQTMKPDVVVSYWAFPDGDGGLQVAREFNIPSVVIAGGSDVRLLPDEPGRGPAVRRVLSQSHMVTTVSDGLRAATIALGVPAERVTTIRQGINRQVFHAGNKAAARRDLDLKSDAEILLWVGRMVPVKNLDLLVSVMKVLKSARPNIELHLIGDGECREQLGQRVAAEGLSDVVKFQGAVAHDRLPLWYRAADATVLCSHSEGLPNVLRESLASGTPFVATNVGDVKEISDAAFSRIVPPNDVAAFAAAVSATLDSRDRGGPSALDMRTWRDCADEYTALFEVLVKARVAA